MDAIDIEALFGATHSRNTVRVYKVQFAHYAAYAREHGDLFDPDTVAAYRRHLIEQSDVAVSTISLRLMAIRSVAHRFYDEGRISRLNYLLIRDVEVPSEKSLRHRTRGKRLVITPQKMRQMCDLPKATMTNPVPVRDRALLLLLSTTGIKVAEALRIQTEDVVRVGDGYEVRQLAASGSATPRAVAISEEVYAAIHDWLYVRPTRGSYVFNQARVYSNGTILWNDLPMSADAAEKAIRTYGNAVGLKGLRPLDLRRFAGQQMAKHDLQGAQKLLGHKSALSTASLLAEDSGEVPVVQF